MLGLAARRRVSAAVLNGRQAARRVGLARAFLRVERFVRRDIVTPIHDNDPVDKTVGDQLLHRRRRGIAALWR